MSKPSLDFRKFNLAVVIPAYHVQDEIEAVLHSLPDYLRTIIVVDDASPDNTDEMMQQFDDPRIKYFVHEQNQQLPATRNMGSVISSPVTVIFAPLTSSNRASSGRFSVIDRLLS